MSDDIVARLRDFCGWKFQVPECGQIFVPEHISDTGEWIPVVVETGYCDGLRYFMFSPNFMLRQAADEIERLRETISRLEEQR